MPYSTATKSKFKAKIPFNKKKVIIISQKG